MEDAIHNVLAQKLHRPQVILVDDGSVDGSTEIAGAYAPRQDDRVQYVDHDRHANHGMTASRNLGLYCARASSSPLSMRTMSGRPDRLPSRSR